MKQETIAKIVLAVIFAALLIQLTFIVANVMGRDKAITREGKAMLGITW